METTHLVDWIAKRKAIRLARAAAPDPTRNAGLDLRGARLARPVANYHVRENFRNSQSDIGVA